jgi:hypothetical protein
VQATGAEAMSYSVPADARSLELPPMNVAVLELGDPGHARVACPANQLKPTNCALQSQIVRSGAIFGTIRKIWRRCCQIVRNGTGAACRRNHRR